MDEGAFWKSTPKKLFSLLDVHIRLNSSEESAGTKGGKKQAIDAIASW